MISRYVNLNASAKKKETMKVWRVYNKNKKNYNTQFKVAETICIDGSRR